MHALPPWPVARVRVRRWRGAGTAAAAVRRETIEKLVAQPPRIPPPPPPPLCRRLGGLLARTREREREGRGRFFNLPPFIYWNFRPGRLYGLFGLDARIEPLGGRNTEGLGDYRERGFRVVCETNIVGGEVLINERCVPRHL